MSRVRHFEAFRQDVTFKKRRRIYNSNSRKAVLICHVPRVRSTVEACLLSECPSVRTKVQTKHVDTRSFVHNYDFLLFFFSFFISFRIVERSLKEKWRRCHSVALSSLSPVNARPCNFFFFFFLLVFFDGRRRLYKVYHCNTVFGVAYNNKRKGMSFPDLRRRSNPTSSKSQRRVTST